MGEYRPEPPIIDPEMARRLLEKIELIQFARALGIAYEIVIVNEDGVPLTDEERDFLHIKVEERKMRRSGELPEE